jgi:hypothetical protein
VNPPSQAPEGQVPRFERAEVERAVVGAIRRVRVPWTPTVYETRLDGQLAVWKDLGDRPWIVRAIVGPTLRREAGVVQALSSLPSVPRLLGLVGRDGYVMEKLEADRLPHLKDNDLTPEFFDALWAELRAMHDLGVAHGDLRRKNILIDTNDRSPKLIDFGTAVVLGENPAYFRRSVYRKVRRIDQMHYAKLKEYYLPGSLTPEERHWLEHAPWHYRLGKLYRTRIHRPLKWRNLRDRLRKLGVLPKKK